MMEMRTHGAVRRGMLSLMLFQVLFFTTHCCWGAIVNEDRENIPSAQEFRATAQLSELAFLATSTEGNVNWGNFEPILFEDTDSGVELLVAFDQTDVSRQTLYVGFRGTDEGRDWWDNIGIAWSTFRVDNTISYPGRVQRGWYTKLFRDASFLELNTLLQQAIMPGIQKVVLTGHSQGAVMATLYGAYLSKRNPNIKITVHGYGSPRLGNTNWVRAVEQRANLAIYRMVYEEDIVARFPGRGGLGYRHVGTLLHVLRGTIKAYYRQDAKTVNKNGRTIEYLGVSRRDWDMGFRTDPIGDHRIVNYRRTIRQAISGTTTIVWPRRFQQRQRARATPGNTNGGGTTTPAQRCCFRFITCWRMCSA